METPGHIEHFSFQRRGIRVEDLLNKFKSEVKFDTMIKNKKATKKKVEEDKLENSKGTISNDLGNTLGESEIHIVKIPFTQGSSDGNHDSPTSRHEY